MTDLSPLDPGKLLDADGRLTVDLPCLNCGYNLRSQEAVGVCSECGQGVAESLRPDLLWFAPLTWLRGVLVGVRLLIAGGLLSPMMFCAGTLLGFMGGIVVYVGAWGVPLVLLSLGVIRLTRPASREPHTFRLWAPRLAIGGLVLSMLGSIGLGWYAGDVGAIVSLFAMQLSLAALPVTLLRRVSEFALRLPRPRLARWLRWLGIAMGTVALLATVCVAGAMAVGWIDPREDAVLITFIVIAVGLWMAFALLGLAALVSLGFFHARLWKVVRSAEALRRRLGVDLAIGSIDPGLTPPDLPP